MLALIENLEAEATQFRLRRRGKQASLIVAGMIIGFILGRIL